MVQLSPNRQMYKRAIYTFFDWLGDIGGLFDALEFLGGGFMIVY